jgi:hypothetical protein
MAKQQTAVSRRKKDKAQLKVSKKLYNSMNKEAKRQDLSVSKLALEITERGIRKRKKPKLETKGAAK